ACGRRNTNGGVRDRGSRRNRDRAYLERLLGGCAGLGPASDGRLMFRQGYISNALILLALMCAFATACAQATGLASSSPLDAGYRDMYNLQFGQAHQDFAAWEQEHPEDPLGPASDA